MTTYELAQANIGVARFPTEAREFDDFKAGVGPVNDAADRADGFVWRFVDASGHGGPRHRAFGDERIVMNLSVWRDPAALAAFVGRGLHRELMRRRDEWFERQAAEVAVLWWVPAGVRPTVADGEERLLHLRAHGPTAYAFTLGAPFPPPAAD
ncbi:DUF3291 domain-containing protein [Streptomyces antimicrobicus]|uniref:DUF3291 domain-containing protein n=1 Tax=Streptomyces antimicrobicus TaxID=2883108 RepID=A0ABS8BBK4_9ACTN|nr:DUF3291 domain-containing protein [Streptomyces antimicrobicus]MCB5182014.1 DUF3291 domain-containing protein [Streptomyces antimicrobicus]